MAAIPTPPSISTEQAQMSCAGLIDFSQHLPLETRQILSQVSHETEISISRKVYAAQDTLIRKSGYYIVPFDGKFFYIPYRGLEDFGEHLIKMPSVLPPVLREGLVIHEGAVYYVTHQDLVRGIVRKSRQLKLRRGTINYHDFISGNIYPTTKSSPVNDGTSATETNTGSNEDGGADGEVRSSRDEPNAKASVSDLNIETYFKDTGTRNTRLSGADGMADSEEADMAFKDQVKTLLGNAFEEEGSSWEEWEIQEDSQS